jgi:hypothetical protein
MELADQRLLRRLAGFDLAAGKLPEAGHRLAGRALGNEDAAVDIDQRDGRHQHERPLAERRRSARTLVVEAAHQER